MVSFELRNQVQKYIESEINYSQLEEWFVPRLPVYLSAPNSANADVVAVIELGLAELSAGLCNEEELRKNLSQALREHSTTVRLVFVSSTSSNSTIPMIAQVLPSISSVTIVGMAPM